MMTNAIRVLEAFVLDDPGSRFLDAIQNGAERPCLRVDDRVFNPCRVLDRIRPGHPVTFDDVNLVAVKVSSLIQPKLIGQRNDICDQGVSLPPITSISHPPIGAVEVRPTVRMKDAKGVILPVSYTHLRAHETPEHLVC